MPSLTHLLLLSALLGCSLAQMVKQCTCSELEPCKSQAAGGIMQCADQCQSHVSKMGASYPALRQCLMAKEGQIRSVFTCEQSQLSNACASGPGKTVPKRFPETLKIAAFSEINAMLARSGIQAEAKSFLSVGKKFASCVMKCMDRGGGQCYKKLGCGLALPADNVIVQQTKQCAIRSGFNTPAVQQLCNCVAGAGVKNLAPLCSRLIVS